MPIPERSRCSSIEGSLTCCLSGGETIPADLSAVAVWQVALAGSLCARRVHRGVKDNLATTNVRSRAISKQRHRVPETTKCWRPTFAKHILPFKAWIRACSLDDLLSWVRHEGAEFLCLPSGTVRVFTEFYAPVMLEVGETTYFDSKMATPSCR